MGYCRNIKPEKIEGIEIPIKIKCVDFWPGYDQNNIFYELLSQKWKVEITDKPDYLISSVWNGTNCNGGYGSLGKFQYGGSFQKYKKCVRIFYTAECVRPNWDLYDYCFTFDYLNPVTSDPTNIDRHFRLPWYYFAWGLTPKRGLKHPFLFDKSKNIERSKFCAFLAANPYPLERLEFFDKLSKYKQVDAAGPVRNNIDHIIEYWNKPKFLSDYKFSMAFENISYPGYTTEKLHDAMAMNTIPIYWGDPLVHLDFNLKSFINVSSFPTMDEAVEYGIKVDQDNNLYSSIFSEPYFNNNKLPDCINTELILNQFTKIFRRGSRDLRRTSRF